MNSIKIKNDLWKEIRKIKDEEIDSYIADEIFYFCKYMHIKENKIYKMFNILNNYEFNNKNIMHQRKVLYNIKKYKNNIKNENK